jgi:hypothetical protein
MTFDTFLFCCAICERDIRDWPNRKGRDRHVEPICRICERWWTERTGKPQGGSMMDRRKALHLLALSNALHNTASIAQWNASHG